MHVKPHLNSGHRSNGFFSSSGNSVFQINCLSDFTNLQPFELVQTFSKRGYMAKTMQCTPKDISTGLESLIRITNLGLFRFPDISWILFTKDNLERISNYSIPVPYNINMLLVQQHKSNISYTLQKIVELAIIGVNDRWTRGYECSVCEMLRAETRVYKAIHQPINQSGIRLKCTASWNIWHKYIEENAIDSIWGPKYPKMTGINFRVTLVEDPPYIIVNRTSTPFTYYGYLWDIFIILQEHFNFTYSVSLLNDGSFGIPDVKTGEWDGLIGEIINDCKESLEDERILEIVFQNTSLHQLRAKVFEKGVMEMSDVMQLAASLETAEAQARVMAKAHTREEVEHPPRDRVNRVTRQPRKVRKARTEIQTEQDPICQYCKNAHKRNKLICPAFGATCSACGRKNHFARCCRSSTSKHSINVAAEGEITMLGACNFSAGEAQSQAFAHLIVNGVKRKFLVDTGASETFIPKSFLPQKFVLTPCAPVSCYGGTTLQPLGRANILVTSAKGTDHRLEVLVEADMALASITVTQPRAEIINFLSSQLSYTGVKMLYKKPQNSDSLMSSSSWKTVYTRPFQQEVWLFILATAMLCTLVLTAIENLYYNREKSQNKYVEDNWFLYPIDNLLYMYSALLQQGWERTPKKIGSRVIVIFFRYFSTIMYAGYSAVIISQYIVSRPPQPINNIADIYENKIYRLGTIRSATFADNMKNAKGSTLRTGWEYMMEHTDNIVENFPALKEKILTEKFVGLYDEKAIDYLTASNCSFIAAPQVLLKGKTSLALHKNSSYTEAFSNR
ncbi:Glutamate receptor ionotropic, kainate 1 [Nymphon striatum]|nr:Glutamate receptor ionotropic, kainate 1 [Nymphon striatum]